MPSFTFLCQMGPWSLLILCHAKHLVNKCRKQWWIYTETFCSISWFFLDIWDKKGVGSLSGILIRPWLEMSSRSRFKNLVQGSGGLGWAPPPHGPKFSQFHAVFRKIWQNHMLAPPWRVGAPSYGESWTRPCKRGQETRNPSFSWPINSMNRGALPWRSHVTWNEKLDICFVFFYKTQNKSNTQKANDSTTKKVWKYLKRNLIKRKE